MKEEITVRPSLYSEIDTISEIHQRAFGSDIEARLVRELMGDATAEPVLSLLAISGNDALGHILFTSVRLEPDDNADFAGSLLAPLAVIPEAQGKGIGGELIREGMRILEAKGTSLVFVLGYPEYYTRFGFSPAGVKGFNAPYPIAAENADAWMVSALRPLNVDPVGGTVCCADSLMRVEYWVE